MWVIYLEGVNNMFLTKIVIFWPCIGDLYANATLTFNLPVNTLHYQTPEPPLLYLTFILHTPLKDHVCPLQRLHLSKPYQNAFFTSVLWFEKAVFSFDIYPITHPIIQVPPELNENTSIPTLHVFHHVKLQIIKYAGIMNELFSKKKQIDCFMSKVPYDYKSKTMSYLDWHLILYMLFFSFCIFHQWYQHFISSRKKSQWVVLMSIMRFLSSNIRFGDI